MGIEFACPNGHRLSCPDQFAGRSSKCPKCGATFQVPAAAAPVAAVPAASATSSAESSADDHEPVGGLDDADRFLPPEEDVAGAFDDDGGFPDFTGGDSSPAQGVSPSTIGAAIGPTTEPAEPATAPSASSKSGIAIGTTGGPVDAAGAAAQRAPQPEPTQPAAEKSAAGSAIVFLCPSGHKLNAPAALAGRAGKCPHCGAKFVIPNPDESEEESAAFPDFAAASDEAPQRPAGTPPPLPQSDGAVAAEPELPFDFAEIAAAGEAAVDRQAGAMGHVFARLWQDRGTSSIVEIRLQCGDLVVPDWYSPQLSAETYGMFATQDKDGRFTLTAVNWQAVERISVRGIDELPEGAFE